MKNIMTGQVSERIRSLLLKQMQGPLSAEEAAELALLTKDAPALQELVTCFSNEAQFDAIFKEYLSQRNNIKAELDKRFPIPAPIHRVSRRWWYLAAAASLLLVIVSTVYIYRPAAVAPAINKQQAVITDKAPGAAKAILTLADQTTIDLSQLPEGAFASRDNIAIKKTGPGSLEYGKYKGTATRTNVLSTPRGGFFQVQLSDGSKVWLNAATSLTYPEVFPQNERVVKISGEAYFEVTKDRKRPFRVQLKDNTEVLVVGTRFNCLAYEDEGFSQTTLLEGVVQMKSSAVGAAPLVLKPGQQAEKSSNNPVISIKEVDAAQSTAWINGSFYFDRVPLPVVFRQLERWYDVHFEYAPAVIRHAGTFKGDFERNIPLSAMLSKLSFVSSLKYSLSGTKVLVYQ